MVQIFQSISKSPCIVSFPKKTQLREKWIRFLDRSEDSLPKSPFLCSQHFEESDFETSTFRKTLVSNAVPTIHVDRQKYDKISQIRIAPLSTETIFVEGRPSSRQSEMGEETYEPMDMYEESQLSPKRTSHLQVVSPSFTIKKLQEQIKKISSLNIQQAQQIRNLQKLKWSQQKRIAKLNSLVNELMKKNSTNVIHDMKKKRRRSI